MIDLDEVLRPLADHPPAPPTPLPQLEARARDRRRRRHRKVGTAGALAVLLAVGVAGAATVVGRDDRAAVSTAPPDASGGALLVGWVPPGTEAVVSPPTWSYERSQRPGRSFEARILEIRSADGREEASVVVTPWSDPGAIDEVARLVPGVRREAVAGHAAVVYPACTSSVAWVEGGYAVWVRVGRTPSGCDGDGDRARALAGLVEVVGGRPVLAGAAADGFVATEATGPVTSPFPDQRVTTRRIELRPTGDGDDATTTRLVDVLVLEGPRVAGGGSNVLEPDGGVEITVQGRPATLHPMPPGHRPVALLVWSPADGTAVSLSSATVDGETLVRIAGGLTVVPGG